MPRMKFNAIHLIATMAFGHFVCGGASAADVGNPLEPKFETPQEAAYWKDRAGKSLSEMDLNGDGQVTKEEFIKYYEKKWDHADPNHTGVMSIEEFVNAWAATETQDRTNPEYKSNAYRREHALLIDADHDGKIEKDEFLKHMETHWSEATQRYQATSLTHDQAVQELIANDPLNPAIKPH
jgi:Ca2+-binding EF-hand superfamily protein